MNITVHTIESAGLGDRSYLVDDGQVAFAVDPPRDIDRVVAVAADAGVEIEAVFETHLHNDYVSGALALARATGAIIHASGGDDRSFDVHAIADGETVSVGTMTVQARHTPGHTHTHLSFVLSDADGVHSVYTGGSLLYGTVGRTDLLGDEATDELTRAQWTSVRSLVEDLPDHTAVYPTHGFGSFCSAKAAADRDSGTIGDEHDNPAVTNDDVDDFVTDLLAGLTDYPAYYAHMAHLNRAGASAPDLSAPTRVDADELASRLDSGEWVVDLRDRKAYAGRHLIGTMNFEADGIPTHLGWLMPWGARLTLVAADPDTIADAQRTLSHIGIDRPGQGDLGTALEELPTGDYPIVDYDEVASAAADDRPFRVVDVRRRDEYEDGHLDGAVNIPLHELLDHLHHVPDGPLGVHCASGARASIAASLLARAGLDVTLINGGPSSA